MTDTYIEHADAEHQGIRCVDVELAAGNFIWLGIGATNGAWMSAVQVKAFATQMIAVADAHIARTTP